MNRIARIRTLAALGPGNLARVGIYRLGLRTGLHPVQRIAATAPSGPFFRPPPRRSGLPDPNRAWDGKLLWYDWKEIPNDGAPSDWFAHPFAGGDRAPGADRPWWRIPDFGGGDIKNIWELSRFGWAVAMATEAAAGDDAALDRLNDWLQSWTAANPPYFGPNWKCGQEASIRVMHLLVAAIILGQDGDPLPGLTDLIGIHLRRIAPTLSYAIGQQNNHGTSEAAALFIGGDFLARAGDGRGEKWARQGRRLLENRAAALIEPDGSFSQYSVVYHRLMLDTCSLAEAWRRRRGLPAFSDACLARLKAATDWLDHMIDRTSGDAPNLGANDGARLMPLTEGYRDFRPSLQLASALFRDARAIGEGRWNDPLRWLEIPLPELVSPLPESRTFDHGGYHILRSGEAISVLRYPRFRFRPSQADSLHFDLWAGGRNLLRDAGTFSYNDPQAGDYFSSTAAHNTIEFDGRDQMARLGRFLFGGWLKAFGVVPVHESGGGMEAAAAYRDRQGAEHHRHVRLEGRGFTCTDKAGGTFRSAVLRWRLPPGSYQLEGNCLTGEGLRLTIEAEGAEPSINLGNAPESRFYQHRSDIPVLEVRIDRPCRIFTIAEF